MVMCPWNRSPNPIRRGHGLWVSAVSHVVKPPPASLRSGKVIDSFYWLAFILAESIGLGYWRTYKIHYNEVKFVSHSIISNDIFNVYMMKVPWLYYYLFCTWEDSHHSPMLLRAVLCSLCWFWIVAASGLDKGIYIKQNNDSANWFAL